MQKIPSAGKYEFHHDLTFIFSFRFPQSASEKFKGDSRICQRSLLPRPKCEVRDCGASDGNSRNQERTVGLHFPYENGYSKSEPFLPRK